MPLKSVVDIDVNDEQFRRFAALFEKYRDALDKTPGAWAEVGREQKGIGQHIRSVVSALMAQAQLGRESAQAAETQSRSLRHHETLWKSISRSSGTTLRNVLGITRSVLRWGVGLAGVGGIVGGASLFGLGRLAEDVSGRRNYALGSFTQIGQRRAFGLYAGRNLENSSGFLGDVAQALHTIGPSRAALSTLGVGTAGGTMDVAQRALLRVQQLAKAQPAGAIGNLMQMYQLGTLGLSERDVFRLRNLSRQELLADIRRSRASAGRFGLSDRTGQQWQNFQSQLGATWGGVWTGIVKDLTRLTGPLTRVSQALGHAADTLLSSPELKKGLDEFAKGIDQFAHWLVSPGFQKGLDNFVSRIGTVAHILGFTGSTLSPIGGAKAAAVAANARSVWAQRGAAAAKKYGIPVGMLHSQYQAFAGAGEVVNPYWLADFDKGVPQMSARDKIRASLAAYYLRMHHLGIAGAPFREMLREHPDDWFKRLNRDVQGYVNRALKVDVEVHNQTGQDVHASVNQLSPQVP